MKQQTLLPASLETQYIKESKVLGKKLFKDESTGFFILLKCPNDGQSFKIEKIRFNMIFQMLKKN